MFDVRTQMIAALFRPAPGGGYVYAAPFHWSFAKRPHYLVNEAQKQALIDLTISKRPILTQVLLWTALCATVAVACVTMWAVTGHDNPTTADVFGIIGLTIVQCAVALAALRAWKLRQVRPLLATLTPTELRITRAQAQTAATDAMSVKQLVVTGASGAFAATASAIDGTIHLAAHKPMGFYWLTISLVFAFVAWRYFRLAIKRRGKDAQINGGSAA